MESSAWYTWRSLRLLVDVTRHFDVQARRLDRPPDAILLTHAHRDAAGGVGAKLRRYCREQRCDPIPLLAHPDAIDRIRTRTSTLDHVRPVPTGPGRPVRIGAAVIDACDVPHASTEGFPTYAWRVRAAGRTVVYASDVSELTPRLRRFAARADLLVVDGAMYRRARLSHLRIDEDLPRLCDWPIGRIVLTQIGRSAPDHHRLVVIVAELCSRAIPAHDGLVVET